MKREEAIERAIKRAKLKNETRYVVFEPNDFEDDVRGYHVASDFDLETFFDGAPVVFCTDDVI